MRGAGGWDGMGLKKLIKVVRPYWPDVDVFRERAVNNPSMREQLKRACLRRIKALGLDPEDKFLPPPEPGNLGEGGLFLGEVPGIGDFRYEVDELCTGMVFLGSPKSGKTCSVCHTIKEAQRQDPPIGCVVACLRGDFLELGTQVSGALVIPAEKDRFNPLEPPPGVEQKKWNHLFSARITRDLGLQFASEAFAIKMLSQVSEKCAQLGRIPNLVDFYRVLESYRPRPRSSEEGYWERLLARIRTLIDVYGEDVLGVQKGFPVIEAAEDGRLVILSMRKLPKFLADFLSSIRVYSLYYKRLHKKTPFGHPPVLFILDEQRSLIRKQNLEFGIPDLELLFTRSRALNIGWVVAEQLGSQVSPALLISCRLRMAFNTSPPENLFSARLLGLNQGQTEELHNLPPGHCIARLAGDRIPDPFKMVFPDPHQET